jgi:type 1 glutamine amidotransferase
MNMVKMAINIKTNTVQKKNEVHNIRDRIEYGRHVGGHGYWGDLSAEAIFYGLMTGIIFYNQE